jgi:hypothetical protein
VRRVSSFLGLFEFHALLFFAALFLFSRPVLLLLDDERPAGVILSFFVPWALVVLVLFAASRTYRATPPRAPAEDDANAPNPD